MTKKSIFHILIAALLASITLFSFYNYFYETIGYLGFLFLLIIFPLHYFALNLIKYSSIKSLLIEIAIVYLLSTIIMKSFLIHLYPVYMGISALLYGLGWTFFGMSIIFILKHHLSKISWDKKELSEFNFKTYLIYCLPSFLIFSLMLVIYFPGIGSIDTIVIWNNALNNTYNDLHPLMFTYIIKLLSLIWENIAVVSIFQVIICSLTFGYVAYYFKQKGLCAKYSLIVSIILPLIPVNTIYSITLWKDVPYTLGLIVFSILILKSVEDNYFLKKANLIKFLIISLLILYTRHNALLPIFGTIALLGFYFLIHKRYKETLKSIIIIVSLVIIFFGSKTITVKLLGDMYTNSSMLSSSIPNVIQTQQILYIEDYYGDTFSIKQREKYNKFFDVEEVEAHKFKYRMGGSYGPNWMFYHMPHMYVNSENISKNSKEFWEFYFDLIKQHPVTAFDGYQKITGITWATVDFGPTAYRAYTRVEFNKYINDSYKNTMLPVSQWLDKHLFTLYRNNWIIFLRPALYMLLTLFFTYLGFKRHNFKIVFLVLPALLNTLGYLIIIAAQDVRYLFINYSIALIAFIYALMRDD